MCFLIWPRIKRNLSWACIIHTEMASNELARLVRRLLVYNGICARATANFWGWYKAKKTQSGQHITGRVIQFTGSSLPPFSVSNSSRSSLGGSETELKMSQTRTISWLTTRRGEGGPGSTLLPRSDGFELHVLQRSRHRWTMSVSKLLTARVYARACACVLDLERSTWPSTLGFPTSGRTIQAITSFPAEFRQGTIYLARYLRSIAFSTHDALFYSTCFVYFYLFILFSFSFFRIFRSTRVRSDK